MRYWHFSAIYAAAENVSYQSDSVAKLRCIFGRGSSFFSVLVRLRSLQLRSMGIEPLEYLGPASSYARRWSAAEEFNEASQVLCGCGKQHLVPGAGQASQPEPIKPEDALHMRKTHLDFLAVSA